MTTTSGGWSITASGRDGWADDATLLGDLDTVRTWWALEVAYPQVYVAGTVHNELLVTSDDERAPAAIDAAKLDVPPDGAELDRRDMSAGARHANLRRAPQTPEERILWAAVDRPDEIVHREATETGPAHVDPSRTWRRARRRFRHRRRGDGRCSPRTCPSHRAPPPRSAVAARSCTRASLIEGGGDPEPVLAASYRPRRADEFDEAGLRSAARRQARSGLGR